MNKPIVRFDPYEQGLAVNPWESLRDRTLLGGVGFARRLAQGIGLGKGGKPRGRRLGRPTVAQIISAVEAVKGEKWERGKKLCLKDALQLGSTCLRHGLQMWDSPTQTRR